MQIDGTIQEPMSLNNIKGKPYEAQCEWIYSKRAPSEQSSEEIVSGRAYRDSEGRERRDQWLGAKGDPSTNMATIYDPIGGFLYTMDVASKTVFKDSLPNEQEAQGWTWVVGKEVRYGIPRQKLNGVFHLGQKLIEGFVCNGYRWNLQGNRVGEYWYSEELMETLLVRVIDEYGENTVRLFAIRRGEPDNQLFVVPIGYTEIR